MKYIKFSVFFLILINVCSTNLKAQTNNFPYYDAVLLKNYTIDGWINWDTINEFWQVLNKYYQVQDSVDIDSLLYANPFFKEIKGGSPRADGVGVTKTKSSFLTSPLKSISGLDVTTFADGLAQFMIERAKGEISVAFIQRFKNEMEKNPELQVLFPKTSDFLENILAYEYTIMLPALQKAFDDDLSKMFFNTRNIFDLPEYRKVIIDNPEVGLLLNSMYTIAKLENGVHPADILAELNTLFETTISDWENLKKDIALKNFKSVIGLSNLISQSLRFDEKQDILFSYGVNHIKAPDSILIKIPDTEYGEKRDSIKLKVPNFLYTEDRPSNFEIASDSIFVITPDIIWENTEGKFKIKVDSLIIKTPDNMYIQVPALQYIQTPDSLYKQKPGEDTTTIVDYNNPSWISDYHLELLFRDKTTFTIFLGLLYQQSLRDNIHFVIHMADKAKDTTIFFHEFLKKNKENIYFLKSQFLKFQRLAGDVDFQLARINRLKSERRKPEKEDYYKFIDVSLDVTEYGSNLVGFLAKDNNQFSEIKSNQYLAILRDINEFYKASYSKDYSTMIAYGVNVLDAVYEIYAEKKAEKKLQAKANNCEKDKNKNKYIYSYEKKHKRIVNREKGEFPKSLSSVMRYGTFMAQIAEADSGAQVKEIIETFALPIGSSSLKKYQVHNVAVNSYLGMAYKNLDPLCTDDKGIFRFYAPIGVIYTPLSFGKAGSLSVFASLIDIGAIVGYRVTYTSDTTISTSGGVSDTIVTKNVEYSNKIQLGNIFSPGFYVVYGFGCNLPIAIGVGTQYGPGLSKITKDGNELSHPKWMFNVSLTVDIPIINLHPGRRRRF